MKTPYSQLKFPIGGINRRVAYQWQPPYTSGDLQNVIPDDALLGRERGGTRPGLSSYGASATVPRLVGEVRYVESGTLKSRVMVAAGTALYADNGSGTFSSVGSVTFDRPAQGASFLQKFFLSAGTLKVYDPVAASFGSVAGDNTLIEPTSYGAFSGGTVTIVSGVVTLDAFSATEDTVWPQWADVSGFLQVGTSRYKVASRDSDTQLTLADLTVNAAAGTEMFLQSKNPVTYADEGETAPSPPSSCWFVVRWANRLVLAGDTTNPAAIYFSGLGNPSDWRYALTNDFGAAVSMTSSTDGGAIGDIVTALIPHNDECLVIGCRSSLLVQRGNPAGGGKPQTLSEEIGVLGPHAWCYDDEGFLWFMSNKGLYVMPPGCGSTPTAVSANVIPKDLSGVDITTEYVTLAYDSRFRGIHLYVTNIASGTDRHYFVATKTTLGGATGGQGIAAFFPLLYTVNPVIVYSRQYFAGTAAISPVLIFDTAGASKYWDTAVACENASYADFGVFPFGPPGFEGLLTEIDVTLATGSGAVTLAVRSGDSAEAAQAASTFESQTLAAGLNSKMRPRIGGAAGVIRLSSDASVKWALEDITIRRELLGPRLVP